MSYLDWNVDETWTLFLDRDGVINERILNGYVTDISEFHFKENVLLALSGLTKKFKYIFVVTNQQGVGLGHMTKIQLDDIHDFMKSKVSSFGGQITQVFSSIELKNSHSATRKPSPEMALIAKSYFSDVTFEKSIMVGDTDTDIQFGKRLGMKTVLILTDEKVNEKADIELMSLFELNKLLELKK
jgi:histidinol-phosphate phosphatase family protein